jgi:hypothetical protein
VPSVSSKEVSLTVDAASRSVIELVFGTIGLSTRDAATQIREAL